MRLRLLLSALFCATFFGGVARGQDLPTTHDLGITITPDDLTAAIQETQDFWGPVRKYLLGPGCSLGEATPRSEAVDYLKTVHDGLHDRLFEKTEAEAMDLIVYLGHRLRMFEVYRRLRNTLADDAAMAALLKTWQHDIRELQALPRAEQPQQIESLLVKMDGEMKARGIAAEKIGKCRDLWALQAQVLELTATTAAGRMMIDYEVQAKNLHANVGEILLVISNAADWVLITRDVGVEIGQPDFVKALVDLRELNAKQTALVGGATTR